MNLFNLMSFISNYEIPVFMLHHVVDCKNEKYFDKNIFITRDELDLFIKDLKQKFQIICLKDLIEKKSLLNRRSCILTFDDGWGDNYSTALPVLKNHAVPATIFITTGMIGSPKSFWFDRLSNFVSNTNYESPDFKINFKKSHPFFQELNFLPDKREQFYALLCSMFKSIRLQEIDEILFTIEYKFGISTVGFPFIATLTWEEIKEMCSEKIVFGSHGVSHSIFTTLTASEKYHEASNSKQEILNNKVNFVNCFSFPNGNYDNESLEIVTKAGYDLIFSASINKCGVGKSPLLVHRINITSDDIVQKKYIFKLIKAKFRSKLMKLDSYR